MSNLGRGSLTTHPRVGSLRVNNLTPGTHVGVDSQRRLISVVDAVGAASLGDLSTGTTQLGGILSVVNATQYQVTAGVGQIIQGAESGSPTRFDISWATQTNTLSTIGTGQASHIGFDSSGSIIEQNAEPTEYERLNNIFVGTIGHSDLATIEGVVVQVDSSLQPADSLHSFMRAVGLINKSGNLYTADGLGALGISKTSGEMAGAGINMANMGSAPGRNTGPEVLQLAASGPGANFTYVDDLGAAIAPLVRTAIDPALFNVIGAFNPAKFGVQRIFLANNAFTLIMPTQQEFNSLSAAELSVTTATYVTPAILSNTLFRGWLCSQGNETNLDNAIFIAAPNLPGALGTGGGISPGAGDVMGPATSVVGNVPLWNDTVGELLMDSGVALNQVSSSIHLTGATSGGSGGGNVSMGIGALSSATTASNCVAIGNLALNDITTTLDNTAVGYTCLPVFTGTQTTAVGSFAGLNLSTATGCTTHGYGSGFLNSTGANMTAIGHLACGLLGADNTAVGAGAMAGTGAGADNTAVGAGSMAGVTSGARNTAVGSDSLSALTISSDNVAIGYNAGRLLNSSGNVAIGAFCMATAVPTAGGLTGVGFNCMANLITGSFSNTGVGYEALKLCTSGDDNHAFGRDSLFSVSTGNQNCGYGRRSGTAVLGSFNCFFGHDCGMSYTGSSGTGFGHNCLRLNTGPQNTAVGKSALAVNTTALGSTAVGFEALALSTGNNNTAVGANSSSSITTGGSNVSVGSDSLDSVTTQDRNVAVGTAALQQCASTDNTGVGYIAANAVTSGKQNTSLGAQSAGTLTTGDNNVCIGYLSDVSGAASADSIVIGAGVAATATAQTRIGGGNTTTLFMRGAHGVTIGGSSTLLINSSGQMGTIVSSGRFKHTITDLVGAERIYDLQPRNFYYTPDRDPEQTLNFGLIAEEVNEVIPEIVVKSVDEDGKEQCETVQYFLLIPLMLDCIIKQKAERDVMAKEMDLLYGMITKLGVEQAAACVRDVSQKIEIQALATMVENLVAAMNEVPDATDSLTIVVEEVESNTGVSLSGSISPHGASASVGAHRTKRSRRSSTERAPRKPRFSAPLKRVKGRKNNVE